jgi:hypothetical protein
MAHVQVARLETYRNDSITADIVQAIQGTIYTMVSLLSFHALFKVRKRETRNRQVYEEG